MAIKIKFDLVGNPEPPTIILANRNGNMFGQLKVDTNTIELTDKLNDASEISFKINKYINEELAPLWEQVVDFKLIYCKEWDTWFDIRVELDEETETVKTVFCTQLGQAELSQIKLYNIEINTEKDIERDDYKISILYDANNPDASILHRILNDKAPHYYIAYVSPTIAKIQRNFSFDKTSILDAFQAISEEIGCLFEYSAVIENGRLQRKISVYDLQQYCNNCGHRGEFTDKCPKCDSANITNGYGDDTLIFVTSDELASDGIQLVTDTDSVKNCFKLEASDDLMTATIRNCNPNGTEYIWYFSDDIKEDMSDELVSKIESYNELYRSHYDNSVSDIDTQMLSDYNKLVDKYLVYNENLQKIATPIKGYASLMNAYYNTIDLSLFLKSSLMPSIKISETNSKEQASLLTASSLSPVAVADIDIVSLSTANSAVLAMAKVVVKTTFKLEIKSSELVTSGGKKYWRGTFVVTNYSDEEDFSESSLISVELNDDLEIVTKQKIEKLLTKENTDDLSITGLFQREYDDFCAELKKYALNPLISFYDACQACIDIMIEQGLADKNTWSDNAAGAEGNLYEKLYLPYYNKLQAIESEMKIREDEISIILGVYDTDGNIITGGLQTEIEKHREKIQKTLDFKNYLGENLWLTLCAYRREDTYSNDNYISDGLSNSELFKRAQEFFEVAENEIYKSAELQHSISTTLNNLLTIEKFKPLVDSFENGNWIRVQVNNEIYKLRLIEYGIDFSSFEKISVEFSDVTKVKNGVTDVKSILSQASSMASSYDSVKRQSIQGNQANDTINQWIGSGLNSALVNIQNNNNEEVVLNENGLLCRSYDDITNTYAPEQFRLTHNIMAYTTDNWKTVSAALGKHEYTRWENDTWIKDVGYGLSSTFVTAGYVTGSQIIGGEVISSNYESGKSGTYFDLINGDFEIAGGNIVYDTKDKALTLKNVTIEWSSTTTPAINDITGLSEYLEHIDNIEGQLDARAETWYQDTDPSIEWKDDATKQLHAGDLWHYTGETKIVNGVNRIKNSEWVWKKINEKYQWVSIEISDEVFDTIDGKAQIFTSTPVPPYYVGDLWVQGSTGDILHCIVERAEGQSYNLSDWVKSSKYTDDTKAQEALDNAKQAIADAATGIDLAKKAKEAASEAKEYADLQDSSLSSDLTEAYEAYANSKVGALDSAVANYLGLGGSTLIGGSYVISPYIAGGYLNITNVNNNSRVVIDPNNLTNNNYIFQVHDGKRVSVGIKSDGSASFAGNITATSLTLESGVKIGTGNIDGLSSVATSGSYNDLSNKPKIPSSVSDLGLDTSKIVYKGDIVQSTKKDANGIEYTETTVPTKDGALTYATYDANDYIVFGRSKGTNSDGKDYVCISKEGLLTARNALIYGTIYATDGEFSGNINGGSIDIDEKFTVDSKGNVSINSGGIIKISAGSTSDSFINFGEEFSASKNGVSAISGSFSSLTVGGKNVLTEDSLSSKIVVSTTEPNQRGIIWLCPTSVRNVEYEGFTYGNRDYNVLNINNKTRTLSVSCLSSDVLPNSTFKYTVTFPIILVWDGSKENNVVFSVTATKASDSSKSVKFPDYTVASINEWETRNIVVTVESTTNLCEDATPINIAISAKNLVSNNNLYINSNSYIKFTASDINSSEGTQLCTVYYKP